MAEGCLGGGTLSDFGATAGEEAGITAAGGLLGGAAVGFFSSLTPSPFAMRSWKMLSLTATAARTGAAIASPNKSMSSAIEVSLNGLFSSMAESSVEVRKKKQEILAQIRKLDETANSLDRDVHGHLAPRKDESLVELQQLKEQLLR